MMKKTFKSLSLALVAGLAFTACSKDGDSPNTPVVPPAHSDYQIVYADGSNNPSATYIQGVSTLTSGTITSRVGHQLESSRTARVFVSPDRKHIYSLNYTIGTVEKLLYNGGDKYERVSRLDASVPLGTKFLRFTPLNNKTEASLHYIKATPEGEGVNYKKHRMDLTIGILTLENLSLKAGYQKAIPFYLPDELATAGYYIDRIDAPVLSGGKLYYGAAVSKWNASTGKGVATDRTFTLVVDYSDLSKVSVLTNDKLRGATNGYRTATQYVIEDGSIIQLVSGVQANGQQEVHFARLDKGAYDTSYDINLASLLGKPCRSDGYFYAGGGIAYVPYEDLSTETKLIGNDPEGRPTKSAMWKLARIDLRSRTAIDLTVPDGLWLRQYQHSVVRDGVFYIALSPIGKPGYVYMFDVASTSKTGRMGAALNGIGADQYFIGIY